jgi:hypothetical protein
VVFTGERRRWRIFSGNAGATKVADEALGAIGIAKAPAALFAHAFAGAVAALRAVLIGLATLWRRQRLLVGCSVWLTVRTATIVGPHVAVSDPVIIGALVDIEVTGSQSD